MFYKITNTESELYQKLHDLRIKELEIDKENEKAIKEKIDIPYSGFYGKQGQGNMCRTNRYAGFVFTDTENIDSKIWKQHKEHKEVYVPNKRTKVGREMNEFLSNLPGSNIFDLWEILRIDMKGKFRYPYLFIHNGDLYLYSDDEVKDENAVEITKREFDKVVDEYNKELTENEPVI